MNTRPIWLTGWLAIGCLHWGCQTMTMIVPPTDLTAPGWQIRETAALWRPRAAAAELAGELLVARHPDGSQFVQFSKQGLPLVTARTTTNAWEISSTLRASSWSQRLPASGPTDRVPWFHLGELPPHAPAHSRWQLMNLPDGRWRLQNPRTGETVEGIPLP